MDKYPGDPSKNVKVEKKSKEYKDNVYNLHLYLGVSAAEVYDIEMTRISHTNKLAENAGDEKKLESWVNQDSLGDNQTLENNFNISPENPMMFRVGRLFDSKDEIPEDREYTFIICKISGKVFTHK